MPTTDMAAPECEVAAPEGTATELATATGKNTARPGYDDFDKRVADQVDFSIWQAVFNGRFRLAVKCDICGRWLTAGTSKQAHRGPRCAAKAAEAVTA